MPLRLLGGVAIHLRGTSRVPESLTRSYADLDFVTRRGAGGVVGVFFRNEGYTAQTAFNALHGNERLLFFDDEHDRQVDVFVGKFRMSHEIQLDERLELEPQTLPLAELLLTKLQVIEMNEKDLRDALALLLDHPVGDTDGDTVNAARIASLCSSDWGLWRTFTRNVEWCRDHLAGHELPDETIALLHERLDRILERIEAEPKTRGWKLRAKIGERKRWYELPEEVAGGP